MKHSPWIDSIESGLDKAWQDVAGPPVRLPTLELINVAGGFPFIASCAAASRITACKIAAPRIVERGPSRCGIPAISTAASPHRQQLSSTASAISKSRFPEE